MARPTKLTKELVDKAATYLDACKLGGAHHPSIPSDWGLAIYLGIGTSTLYVWAKLDTPLAKQFQDILDDITAQQGFALFNGGATGKYNSTIVKMMLSAKHGIVEKTATDVTTAGGPVQSSLPPEMVASFATWLSDSTKE